MKKRGIPTGSHRIPQELRNRVAKRVRIVMKEWLGDDSLHRLCVATAEDLKVHPQTVYNWHEGYCLPTLWNLIRFCDYFECSVDYMLGRTAYRQLITPAIAQRMEQMAA